MKVYKLFKIIANNVTDDDDKIAKYRAVVKIIDGVRGGVIDLGDDVIDLYREREYIEAYLDDDDLVKNLREIMEYPELREFREIAELEEGDDYSEEAYNTDGADTDPDIENRDIVIKCKISDPLANFLRAATCAFMATTSVALLGILYKL